MVAILFSIKPEVRRSTLLPVTSKRGKKTKQQVNFSPVDQPGVVAHACNPATWRLGSLNGLRVGFLGAVVLCRSGVRAKFGVNMGNTEESEFSRLVKEERTGPGWKHSRQKLPRQTVVG